MEPKVVAEDWRSQFQKSPLVFLAAAFSGGLLMGMATHRRKSRSTPKPAPAPQPPPARRSLSWDRSDSFGVIKSVLIGIAITQAKKLLFTKVPDPVTGAAVLPEHPAPAAGRTKTPPDSTTH